MSVNIISLKDAIKLSRTIIEPRTVRKAYVRCKCYNVIKIKNRKTGDIIECSVCKRVYSINQEIQYKTVIALVEPSLPSSRVVDDAL